MDSHRPLQSIGAIVLLAAAVSSCARDKGPHDGHSTRQPHHPAAASSDAARHNDEPEGHRHHGPGDHRFEDAEQWAKHFDDPARDQWQNPADVVRIMDLRPGMTVADIGAGTGYFIPHLSRAVGPTGSVLGLDVEPDMVRYITARAQRENLSNVTARQVPGDDPGLQPDSVDRVLIVNTWHHISARDKYAARLARALRPAGAVVVVDFTKDSRRGPPVAHRLEPAQVISELAAGGLAAEVVEETLPDQYVVVGRRPR